MLYTFVHPIKEAIEIISDDYYDAQIQLLLMVDTIMDWELYFPDSENIALFI